MIKKLCVLLHGYGSDDKDLASLIPVFKNRLGSDAAKDIDFISIPAPMPCEQGMGLQWASLGNFWETVPYGKDFVISEKSLGEMKNSLEYLGEIISKELSRRKLSNKDLILVGFSQGSSIAIEYTFNCSKNGLEAPCKCIAFSGFLISENSVKNCPTPFLLCHGANDDTVPLKLFKNMCDTFKNKDVKFDSIVSENTGHWISEEGMNKTILFLKNDNI